VNKAKLNYWVDVVIGIAGLGSAVSGLVFLLPGDPASGVLGIGYQAWSAVHTWSSLAVIAGAGAHLALHWKWMVSMTKQMLWPARREGVKTPAADPAYPGVAGRPLSRRAFLVLGGTAAAVAAAFAAGYKAVLGSSPAEASESDHQIAATGEEEQEEQDEQDEQEEQEEGVACPFGMVSDPYPGRCKHYRDSNGDGLCDYSVPGSGRNQSASGDGSSGGGFPRRRSGFGQP
jgi:hypothetical protein